MRSYLLDDLHLPVEARGAALDQRDVGGQTHAVDMAARIEVVECVEDDVEALEPRDVELRVLDVVVVRCDLGRRVEFAGGLLRDLRMLILPIPMPHFSHLRLGLLDVLVAEQELAIQVAEVDGVEVDNVHVAEAHEDEVLEQLAADAARTDHEDARLPLSATSKYPPHIALTSLMRAWRSPRLC